MGKRMRRFLSIILSVVMIMGYIPSTGITAYARTIPDLAEFAAPSDWEGKTETDLVATDFEGFQSVEGTTEQDWERFKEAPTDGIVIYDFNDNYVSIAVYEGGKLDQLSTDTISRGRIYEIIENGDSVCYTVGSTFVETYEITLDGARFSKPDTETSQLVDDGNAMQTVTYTAKEGYRFFNFDDITENGITVSKKTDTEVTVSGTPTADTDITVPDADSVELLVQEIVPQADWEGDTTKYTVDMASDFDNNSLADIENWTDVPGEGIVHILYDVNGTTWKVASFKNGVFINSYEYDITLNDIFTDLKMVGGKHYYTSSKAPASKVSYDVTFKIVNGYWDDATAEDKVVTLKGYTSDELKLSAKQIPAVGSKPLDDYMTGSWDVEPSTSTVIKKDTTYTYTYKEKDPSSVTKAPVAKELIYNGVKQSLVTSGEAEGGTMEYAIGDDATVAPTSGWDTAIPSAVNAGTYYVWYRVKGDETHKDVAPEVVTGLIKKKGITIAGIKAVDKDYDGTTAAELNYEDVTYGGMLNADELTVTATGTFEDKDASDEPKTVYITDLVLGGKSVDNYQLSSDGQQTETTASIGKIAAEVEWDDVTSFTYDGTELKPYAYVSNKIGDDEVYVTVAGGQTDVGIYNATADSLRGIDAVNYYLKDKVTQLFVITKADVDINVSMAGWTYGDEPSEPEIEGVPEGMLANVEYKPIEAGNKDYTLNKPENAGTYNIRVSVEGNKNYNDTSVVDTFVVSPREVELNWDKTEFTYNGEDQCPTVTLGNVVPKDKEDVVAVIDGAATAAGTHTAIVTKLRGSAADNYKLPKKPITIYTINKADLDNPEIILDDWTYGENPNAPIVSGNKEGADVTFMYKETEGTDEYTTKVPVKAGDYTVKAVISATAGYNGATITKDFKINRAPITPEVTITGWAYAEYDKEANAPTISGNTEGGEESFTYYIDSQCKEKTTPENSGAEEEGGVPMNVGTYMVKAEIAKTANYQAGEATCEFAITEADKQNLIQAIGKAEQFCDMLSENDDYEKIAKKLMEAIEAAQEDVNNPNISAEDIAEATEELQDAAAKAEEGKRAIDEANFEKVKEDVKKKADNLANFDDSDACKKLLENAKKNIDAMAYDHSKTPDENKAALGSVVTELKKDLEEQREADKNAEEKEKADTKAADDVTSMIEDIPESRNITKDDKAAVEAARKAYDSLTDDQKAKVSKETLKKLIEAEKAVGTASTYSSEWVDGQWYAEDGSTTYEPKGYWKHNSGGWWFEDENGWFPYNCWQKIDGNWYYFTSDGYMDYSEYRDGYWIGADGIRVEQYSGGHWMQNGTGWWYSDESGWYPSNQWLWIDGKCYYFGSDGYMPTNQYIGGSWVGADGAWVK